jgi:hypothetical protein
VSPPPKLKSVDGVLLVSGVLQSINGMTVSVAIEIEVVSSTEDAIPGSAFGFGWQ